MSGARVRLLARRELGQMVRARWFVAYALVFLAAGAVFAALGAGRGLAGEARVSLRALAGLLHLVLLAVPPMALLPALAAHADDEEGGLLEYVLAQPVAAGEVYLGKWIGAAAGIVLVVVLGMTPGAVAAVFRGAPPGVVVWTLTLTLLLAVAFSTVGLALAVAMGSRGRATAAALILWLVLLVLGSLGIMAAFVRLGAPADLLAAWTVVNPVEAFRVAVLVLVDPDLSLLGPTATHLLGRVGGGGILAAGIASLVAWTAGAGFAGLAAFRRRGA
ncbi:MAG: ABC transporter permease subunit [Gemmatimonadetes bacterium]|nr:ABC transporter permease subunit [Gemmatimonadota bacterium]NIR76921.1 ABC transporter permease subunit [Gemmatimonadota bacterium]NIT85450.1 ABC transporter permease subunit [Gemmatimonadota bacterium]NIU29265.1 ABC transporter permease subunit [Gemmatimonadota bacterium]NIU34343.1 ABC transporter permease subunit [Gemmatimonadota bacterium]